MGRSSGRFSIIPARAIDDQHLGNSALRVLACLGTYADRDGWCWPAVQTIADRLGCTRQAVQRQLRELEKLNYIETKFRTGKSNSYRILHNVEIADVHDRLKDSDNGVQHDVAGVQHGVAEGANVALAGGANVALALTSDRTSQKNDNGAFDKFWTSYPSRKPHSNPKQPAAKKFIAAINKEITPEILIRGAENYAAYVAQENTEPKFIAQAQTWLIQERWVEYQEVLIKTSRQQSREGAI